MPQAKRRNGQTQEKCPPILPALVLTFNPIPTWRGVYLTPPPIKFMIAPPRNFLYMHVRRKIAQQILCTKSKEIEISPGFWKDVDIFTFMP